MMTHDRAVFLGGLQTWTAEERKEMKFEMVRARGSEQTLADMAMNLYHVAAPFMRETDPVWRAMQEEYVAAMQLAGRDPKI